MKTEAGLGRGYPVQTKSFTLGKSEHITDGQGRPQAVTNHLIYDGYQPMQGGLLKNSRERLKTLNERISSYPSGSKFTFDSIRNTNASVFVDGNQSGLGDNLRGRPMGRTLWHGIYDVEDGTLSISFYLRDEPHFHEGSHAVRSAYFEFRLREPAGLKTVPAAISQAAV